MPLMEKVFEICQRYANRGWGKFLKENFGLDINQPNASALAKELNRELHLTAAAFKVPGFQDLAKDTIRGIERGDPARSLLYHAFASPGVQHFQGEEDYLEPGELDVLENYVWVASEDGAYAPPFTLSEYNFHDLPEIPQDLKEYRDSYILVRSLKKLQYVKSDGIAETVKINDFDKFLDDLKKIKDENVIKISLSVTQVEELITRNGKHAPLSALMEKAKALSLNSSPELAIVVFSQEYRQGYESRHRKHADVSFSRTGVARVGNREASYLKKNRGYWAVVEGEPKSIRTLPAKYAPYIAVALQASAGSRNPKRDNTIETFGPLALQDNAPDTQDREVKFWVPLHKLFSSQKECIKDIDLSNLSLDAHHVNEKLRRVHLELKKRYPNYHAETNDAVLSEPPYFMTDDIIANLDRNGYVVPKAGPLVAVARKDPRDKQQPAFTFEVPRKDVSGQPLTFNTPRNENGVCFFDGATMEITAKGEDRPAPEYLHVRRTASTLEDLNTNPSMKTDPIVIIGEDSKPRHAVHYVDFAGDGWVTVKDIPPIIVDGKSLAILPAYSLVTAPDFYPLVTQYELTRWGATQSGVWGQVEPNVLSSQRRIVNLELKVDLANGRPTTANETNGVKRVFDGTDRTLTAIVTLPLKRNGIQFQIGERTNFPEVKRHLSLPDAAAGIFAPGWDISRDNNHLAAYGLGSPFPEDAKLCAALSGFWPAAAPDTTITFNITNRRKIVIPMTDAEIKGENAWDGVQGPTMGVNNGKVVVTYPDPVFVDYVINAEKEKFSLVETSKTTTNDYIRRIDVMRRVTEHLKVTRRNEVMFRDYNLLSFSHEAGNRYHFEFGKVDKANLIPVPSHEGGHRFFRAQVNDRFAIEIGPDNIPIAVSPKIV